MLPPTAVARCLTPIFINSGWSAPAVKHSLALGIAWRLWICSLSIKATAATPGAH